MTIETIQTKLDARADEKLRREIAAILEPLKKYVNFVPGYPQIVYSDKDVTIDTRFIQAIAKALFDHSFERNRGEESSKFIADTESFRQQLEELQSAQPNE